MNNGTYQLISDMLVRSHFNPAYQSWSDRM